MTKRNIMLSIDEINKLEQDLDEAHLQNKKLQDLLEVATKQYNSLLKKYNEVLQLAKENADSNEYVIQELEKENEKLREILVLNIWNKPSLQCSTAT